MTDEERQRQMDFTINALAQLSARFDQSDLERRADAVRLARVEDALTTLTALAVRYDERFDTQEARISTVEEAVVRLEQLTRKQNGNAQA
ncbi:MAG: hypothetical protein WKF30_09425 [Pyrinomonadaceae bacterium]